MIKASLLVLFLSLAFAEAGQGKGSYNKINSSNVALTGSDTISKLSGISPVCVIVCVII